MRTGAGIHDVARWTAPLAVAAGALLCAWMVARIVASLLAATGSAPTMAVASGLPAGFEAPRESLAKWHLFGSALLPVDARSAAIDTPETALDLTLSGILAEADPSAGIAMIAQADGSQAAYRAGDLLPGNARLKGIYTDHVLIVHNGRDEALRLPRERVAAASAAASSPVPSAVGGNDGNAVTAVPGRPAVAGLETVDWNAVQQQIQVDPAELARQVRVAPVIENGQVVGMRLGGGAHAPLLAKLGLQPDDVVTAVNGISVRDTGRAQQVIAAVRDARQVSVTVRRNGREETLNVSLQ